MYLPLASVIVLVVLAADLGLRRMRSRGMLSSRGAHAVGVVALVAAVAVLGVLTHRRNALYATSIGMWEDVVAHRPQNARARNSLVVALVSEGRCAEAIEHGRRVLELDPDLKLARSNLGCALLRQGEMDEALKVFQSALARDPDGCGPEVYMHIGLIRKQQQRFEEAAEYYRKAISLDPRYAAAYMNLGNVLHMQGKYKEAVEAYSRCIDVAPDYVIAPVNLSLGVSLLHLGDREKAIGVLQHALELGLAERNMDVCYDAHYNMGMAHEQLGKLTEAIEHFEQALQIKPDNGELRHRIGLLRQLRDR
jgi:superkiller protein 3